MRTSENLRLGYLHGHARGQGNVVNLQRPVRARFAEREGAILEITFSMELAPNPFVRMLVVASMLTLEPTPKTPIPKR